MGETSKIVKLKEKLHGKVKNLNTLIANDNQLIGNAVVEGRPLDDDSLQIAIARVKARRAERDTLNDILDDIGQL